MEGKNLSSKIPKSFFEHTLKTLRDPLYSPSEDDFKLISSILLNTDFFARIFDTPVELNDFIAHAKSLFSYEVHPYGDILTKSQAYAQKFCIVLKGKVQRLHQRPFHEIEHELRAHEAKNPTRLINETPEPGLGGLGFNLFQDRRKTITWVTDDTAHTRNFTRGASIEFPSTDLTSPRSKANLDQENTTGTKLRKSFSKFEDTLPSLMEMDMESSRAPHVFEALERRANSLTKKSRRTNHSHKFKLKLRSTASKILFQRDFSKITHIAPGTVKSILSIDDKKSPKSRTSLHKNSEIPKQSSPAKASSTTKWDKEDITLINYIATKYPDIKHRCFVKDIILLGKTKEFGAGDYFGENSLRGDQPRENAITVVASGEAHLLTISREHFLGVMDILNEKASEKLEFLRKNFPQFPEDTLLNFSKYFNKRVFQKDEVIYRQYDPASELYLVVSGVVRLSKEGNLSSTGPTKNKSLAVLQAIKKIDLPIAVISENQLFGEEILLSKKERLYTAIANVPDTEVYYLESYLHEKIKDEFKDFFTVMREQAQGRFEWRQERASSLAIVKKHKSVHKLATKGVSLTPKESKPMSLLASTLFTCEEEEGALSGPDPLTEWKIKSENASPNVARKKPEYFLAKSLETYKKRFSRRLNISEATMKAIEKGEKKMSETIKELGDSPHIFTLNGLNIRKELEEFDRKYYSVVKSPSNQTASSPFKGSTTHTSNFGVSGYSKKNEEKGFGKLVEELNQKKGPTSPGMAQKLAKFSYLQTDKLTETAISRNISPNISRRTSYAFLRQELPEKVEKNVKKEGFYPPLQLQDNKKLKKLLQLVNYQTVDLNQSPGSGEKGPVVKSFVNMHTQYKTRTGVFDFGMRTEG